MSQLALGIIETVGLPACIAAADVCVKSANINIVGIENSKGGGLMVLKIEGDVGAVNAAIQAAIIEVNKISRVYSSKVIARPSKSIEILISNESTIGVEKEITLQSKNNDEITKNEIVEEFQGESKEDLEENDSEKIDKEINYDNEVIEIYEIENVVWSENIEIKSENYTCNICKDPSCPRQKGDLRSSCINHNDVQ